MPLNKETKPIYDWAGDRHKKFIDSTEKKMDEHFIYWHKMKQSVETLFCISNE